MKYDRNKWRKLKRKKFNDLITEANLDYLFDRKMNPRRYPKGDEFNPMTTPNRNTEQVPDGAWAGYYTSTSIIIFTIKKFKYHENAKKI